MKANISNYFSKTLPMEKEFPSLSKEEKNTPASSVSEDIQMNVQNIHMDETKTIPAISIGSDFELQNKKRFSLPNDINFVSGNEIMKRFNAHVEAGIIEPLNECRDFKEMKVITVLETAPKILYPLNIAVMENNVSMVKDLLSAGAFLDVKDKTGKTPLANAIELGNTMIIDILIAAKDAEFQHSPQSPYAPSCSNSEYGDNEVDPYEESDFYYPNNSGGAIISEQSSTQQQEDLHPAQSILSDGHHHHNHYHHHHHHHHHHEIDNCGAHEGACKDSTSSITVVASSIISSPPIVAATVILLQPKKPSYVKRLQMATGRMLTYVTTIERVSERVLRTAQHSTHKV